MDWDQVLCVTQWCFRLKMAVLFYFRYIERRGPADFHVRTISFGGVWWAAKNEALLFWEQIRRQPGVTDLHFWVEFRREGTYFAGS